MKKAFLLCWFFLHGFFFAFSQNTSYIIQLNNKAGTPYSLNNPSAYLSPRAIEKRIRFNIAVDSSDLPVVSRYIDSIRLAGNVSILHVSKWFNQVAIMTTDSAALASINAMPFVAGTVQVANRPAVSGKILPVADDPVVIEPGRPGATINYGTSAGQVNIHRMPFLHDRGFRGEGIRLAVFDAGFNRFNVLPTFDSARNKDQFLGSWDFIAKDSSVFEDHPHGMQCLSTIVANMPGLFVGTAPDASFYLFRTETTASEYPIEEHYWLAAAEKADSLGVDVISSSLGYTNFSDPAYDHSYDDMDGNTTIVTKAVDKAAQKGMLVFTSAGNDGANSWRYISAPADADSAITVGAVDTLGAPAYFSSYGPTKDGRIKPDLAAVGWNAIVARPSTGFPVTGNGTSYACPNLAGFGICLKQAFPELGNMEIRDLLLRSADKYNNPDDRVGYGIPDAKKAFVLGIKKTYSRSAPTTDVCNINFEFAAKADTGIEISLERKLPGEAGYTGIFSGRGTDQFIKNVFRHTDRLPQQTTGPLQYRIRGEIGGDTSFILDSFLFEFFRTCVVTEDAFSLIQPYPLLTRATLNLATVKSGRIEVAIHDMNGRMVHRESFSHPAGRESRVFDLSRFSKGVYLFSLFMDGRKIFTKKMIRQ